jgi:UDP-glucose 4-epimerase
VKFIITGGAGFIGSHIVEELANKQNEVVILDNLITGKLENIAPFLSEDGVSFVSGSITDFGVLQKTFNGADGIFHLGAIASVPRSVTNPRETHETNLTGTLNVLSAARDAGVKFVTFASSAAVYGENPALPKRESMNPETISPYAVSKIAGEYYGSVFSQLYDVRVVSLRYFNVFGPRQDPCSLYSGVISRFIKNVLDKKPIEIFGDGKQTRDFIFVKDVVQANMKAMVSTAEGSFNIACGRSFNLLDLAQEIMAITGITVPIQFKPFREGDIRDSIADISRAREVLGYSPKFTVHRGLEETIEWYKAHD